MRLIRAGVASLGCAWFGDALAASAVTDPGTPLSLWWIFVLSAAVLAVGWHRERRQHRNSVVTMFDKQSQNSPTREPSNPQFAHLALRSLHIPVIATQANLTIEFLNPAAERLLGTDTAQANGRFLGDVLKLVDAASGTPLTISADDARAADRMHALSNEYVLTRGDNDRRNVHCTITALVDSQTSVSGYVITLREPDVATAPAATPRAEDHDFLTGLVNRTGFEHELRAVLAQGKSEAVWHSLCYIDLDNFKIVNDTCGHAAGDALLQQLTETLRGLVRTTDVVARLGGDEFVLLLVNCPLEQAQKIGEKVRKKINEHRFTWQDRTYPVSASIGIVEIAPNCADVATVLSTADVACFAAKDLGRNRVHVYLETDGESARRHGEMQWYARITQAHAENRFTLYHQRIESLNHNAPRGEHFEILVRMLDEHGQLVAPGAFLPAAERYNLMPMIDRWVINETFAILRQRNTMGHAFPETVAINLSGASLGDGGLLDYIQDKFSQHRIPAHVICFEVTETAAVSNLVHAVDLIQNIKAMGCRFSLDDFGSGLSSFTYLKNMPVDYLKIDGSFVKDMLSDSINLAMVQSINQIGHVMGIKTIAEFVESEQLAERLKALGVDFAQGYGIEKPRPFTAVVT
jgi:diguanylate cyclase (GGDEF)-like protein